MAEDYEVNAGECVSSIAFEHGFYWRTLWDHSSNAALKARRKDPNVLLAGDVVHIPDLTLQEESGATEARHRFQLKGVPAKLRIRLLEPCEPEAKQEPEGQFHHDGRGTTSEDPVRPQETTKERPRANVPYHLFIDGQPTQGKTDGDGYLTLAIPPNAREGRLVLDPGTGKQSELRLGLGHLDPITEVAGVKQRLANLAFDCGDRTNEPSEALADAIARFQAQNGLPVNGELSDQLRDALKKAHGS